jgi:hypothetical protein
VPVTGWLDALLAYADHHPKAAVVGAKLLSLNDTIQHAGMTITEDLNHRRRRALDRAIPRRDVRETTHWNGCRSIGDFRVLNAIFVAVSAIAA